MIQLIEMKLENSTDPSLKKIKGNIAELTRPARDLKGKIHTQKRKPQGRKQTHKPRPAKYNNWLTPFCWTQIVVVAKQAGRSMGASDIAMRLKKRDPVTFAQISRNMIEGWIDRSSGKPCWKESVLRRVEEGNSPGHNKGGCRGILVCFNGIHSTKS
jgi:hypothetical protein